VCHDRLLILNISSIFVFKVPTDLYPRITGQTAPIVEPTLLKIIPYPGHESLSQIFWDDTKSSLLEFYVLRKSYFGIQLYRFSVTKNGTLLTQGSNNFTRRFDLQHVEGLVLTAHEVYWVSSSKHFIIVWERREGDLQVQMVVADNIGTFSAQIPESISPGIDLSAMKYFLLDPCSGRACVVPTDMSYITTVDYIEPDVGGA
jgi:hypothetical protein